MCFYIFAFSYYSNKKQLHSVDPWSPSPAFGSHLTCHGVHPQEETTSVESGFHKQRLPEGSSLNSLCPGCKGSAEMFSAHLLTLDLHRSWMEGRSAPRAILSANRITCYRLTGSSCGRREGFSEIPPQPTTFG